MSKNITRIVEEAVKSSPDGIATLDILDSLRLCSRDTLKTILSRLGKSRRIIRLKRGVYASAPLRDAFAAAQAVFGGYLGFSSALYLNHLAAEMPFTVTVVTSAVSASVRWGEYEFRAVALGEKAAGFERKGGRIISTRPKTLFDCIYMPQYGVEEEKLVQLFQEAPLNRKEWKEFDEYVKRWGGRLRERFRRIRQRIVEG